MRTCLSPKIVEEFSAHCSWVYEVWLTHRGLFDENPHGNELLNSFAGETLLLLSTVTQEYCLHQIIKLHDPAAQGKRENLTLDFIIERGNWTPSMKAELNDIKQRLDHFSNQLRTVRNRILSHNDLESIISGETLGAFAVGEDEKYLSLLQEFVNKIYMEVMGSLRPFNDLPKNDVAAFINMLKKSQPRRAAGSLS